MRKQMRGLMLLLLLAGVGALGNSCRQIIQEAYYDLSLVKRAK